MRSSTIFWSCAACCPASWRGSRLPQPIRPPASRPSSARRPAASSWNSGRSRDRRPALPGPVELIGEGEAAVELALGLDDGAVGSVPDQVGVLADQVERPAVGEIEGGDGADVDVLEAGIRLV